MTVDDVIKMKGKRSTLSIAGSATLDQLTKKLSDENIGALIIKDEAGNIAGIVSERDVIHQCAKKVDSGTTTVEQIMTKQVLTLNETDDVKVAMEMMCTARVRHLPVVSKSTLKGMVTIGDVVKAMRDTDKEKFAGFLSRFADAEAEHVK